MCLCVLVSASMCVCVCLCFKNRTLCFVYISLSQWPNVCREHNLFKGFRFVAPTSRIATPVRGGSIAPNTHSPPLSSCCCALKIFNWNMTAAHTGTATYAATQQHSHPHSDTVRRISIGTSASFINLSVKNCADMYLRNSWETNHININTYKYQKKWSKNHS